MVFFYISDRNDDGVIAKEDFLIAIDVCIFHCVLHCVRTKLNDIVCNIKLYDSHLSMCNIYILKLANSETKLKLMCTNTTATPANYQPIIVYNSEYIFISENASCYKHKIYWHKFLDIVTSQCLLDKSTVSLYCS